MNIFSKKGHALVALDILVAERLYYCLKGIEPSRAEDISALHVAITTAGGFATEIDDAVSFLEGTDDV